MREESGFNKDNNIKVKSKQFQSICNKGLDL